MMSTSQRARRQRAVLEMAVMPEPFVLKREMKEIFALLRKQNYGVRGYKIHLERVLLVVNKAIAAIDALGE